MATSIAIIGAGISGLSAGIFARLNGFDVTIYEMGQKAGGVCTSWEREGYSVNGSIHWLVGSAPGTDLYDMWRQLGVIEGSTFHNHSCFVEYKDLNGRDVHLYTDIHKLKKHFLEIAPLDEEPIDELIEAIETVAKNTFPLDKPFELFNAWDWTKVMLAHFPAIRVMGKYNAISIHDFAQRFKSDTLRKAFEYFWSPQMSMTFFLIQVAYAHQGSAGYPLGGAGKFVERMVKRYQDLGGKIAYGQKVTDILVNDRQAVGLELNGRDIIHADYIVSAADGHTVLYDLLGEEYIDEKTKKAYQTLKTFPSLVYFSAGVARTFEEVQPSIAGINFPLSKPIQIGKETLQRLNVQVFNFDPTLAPSGKTLLTAMIETDYTYWKELYDAGHDGYQAERDRISKELVDAFDHYLGHIKDRLDFTDLATPITYHQWTGNYHGSYEGWLPTTEATKIRLPQHFKGLDRFYMCGHWVTPGGGMPPAAFTGRDAIQLICRKERKHFTTVGVAEHTI